MDEKTQAKGALAEVREIAKLANKDTARLIHSEASDIIIRLARKYNFNRQRRERVKV